jgi:hypothetical protein
MTRSFAVAPLTSNQIALAFPLVQAVMPEIDLMRWRSFVGPFVAGEAAASSGAMVLSNEAGYLCGVLAYRRDRDLRHGAVLAVDLFTAMDLVRDQAAVQTLLEIAQMKAQELHCTATQIRIDCAQRLLAERFQAAGHRPSAMLFYKEVDRPILPS